MRAWDPDDLQSFTPLRYAVPDVVGHQGLALVTDPDVFAVGDVGELFTRDLQGKAIWCRPRPGYDKITDPLATSVMLLDCSKLPHWRFARGSGSAVGAPHRLSRLDQPQAREARNHRPTRARVERLRSPDAADEAAAQHKAPHAAVEDQACRSTSPSVSARASSTSRCRSCASSLRATPATPTAIRKPISTRFWPKRSTAAQSPRRRSKSTSVSATCDQIRQNLSSATAAICGRRSRLLQKPPDALGDQPA